MATLAPHTVQLHRVPAALLRARTRRDHPDTGGWATTVLRLVRAAVPEQPWNNLAVWPRWQQLLPHVLAVVDPARPVDPKSWELAWLLDRAAEYRSARGEPRDALPLAQRAHALYQANSATMTPTPSLRPTTSPTGWASWVSTSRPAP